MADTVRACADANFARMSKDPMHVWEALCEATDPENGMEAQLLISLLMSLDECAAGRELRRAVMNQLHTRADELTKLELTR